MKADGILFTAVVMMMWRLVALEPNQLESATRNRGVG